MRARPGPLAKEVPARLSCQDEMDTSHELLALKLLPIHPNPIKCHRTGAQHAKIPDGFLLWSGFWFLSAQCPQTSGSSSPRP